MICKTYTLLANTILRENVHRRLINMTNLPHYINEQPTGCVSELVYPRTWNGERKKANQTVKIKLVSWRENKFMACAKEGEKRDGFMLYGGDNIYGTVMKRFPIEVDIELNFAV